MGRQRSEKSIEAERLYRLGTKMSEIAEKLEVPEGTVRRWKSTQKWKPVKANKKKSEPEQKKPKKNGAPFGNQNAKGNIGGGAPFGNHNAVTHGAYQTIMWDTMTDEEKELSQDMDTDPEFLLIEQIRILTIRERRFLKRIQEYEHNEKYKSGIAIGSVTRSEPKRSFSSEEEKELYEERIEDKVQSGERLPGNAYTLTTVSEATYNIIQRLEEGLTRCQNQKYRAIQELNHIQSLKGNNGKNAVAAEWVKALMGANDG